MRFTAKEQCSTVIQDSNYLKGRMVTDEVNGKINSGQAFLEKQQATREFLANGKEYQEKILTTSLLLENLVDTQTLGNVFRKAIKDLGQQLANDPSLQASLDVYTSAQLRQPTVLEDNDATVSEQDRVNESRLKQDYAQNQQQLAEFIETTPIAGYLRRMEPDETKRAEALRVFLLKVTRYAQAVKRSDRVNSPASGDDTFSGRAGQVTYQFDTYLDAAVAELLQSVDKPLPADTDLQHLSDLINQSQVLIESQLDSDNRFFALLNWVSETARKVRTEGLKIFGTPESQAMLSSLEKRSEQKNGLGGVILYGPPGTGKTEYLVERNRRRGFDSRVISIHHFTDFVQLVGEKPVPIGIDKDAAQLQRLQLTQETLKSMSPADRLTYINSKREAGTEQWQSFLAITGIGPEFPVDAMDANVADHIVNMLLQKLNTTIVNVGLGLEAGISGDEAWVKGEIIQAFESGRLPILDEMDKGSSHSLEGISRLLNLSPGDTIQLGGTSYTIPHWGSVDGTANDMNLAPFLHDRFAPNVVYVDYPSPSELLLRSLVWLSDERGNLQIPSSVQEQYLGLVLYVFPQIQKLYPSKIEHPLSNRGIRKFCQMLSQNTPISTAVQELLLKPGALSDKESGRTEVQKILDRFPTLTSPTLTVNERTAQTSKDALRESPLYQVAQELFVPYDASRGESGEVVVDPSQIKNLSRAESAENKDRSLVAPSGVKLAIETKNDQTYLTSRVNGQLLNRISGSDSLVISDRDTQIISCDTVGNRALLRTNNTLCIVDVSSGLTRTEISDSQNGGEFILNPDGQFLIHRTRDSLELHSTSSLLEGVSMDKNRVSFVDRDGDSVSTARIQTSPDGKFLLIESKAHETHIVRLSGVPKNGGVVSLAKPFDASGGLIIGRGNILLNPANNPTSAYMLK